MSSISVLRELPLVAALPPGHPARSAFDPEEQVLAEVLVALADIANDVVDSDPEIYGHMSGGWWRSPARPFDARVQEHVLVLAWFHTHQREWNPYYFDEAVGLRLDAALGYYLRLQHPSGAWPEYAPGQHSRSATGFALECLSAVLGYLRESGALPQRQKEITEALRLAMGWFFDPNNSEVWWDGYVPIANQPAGAIAGALRALALDPSPELEAMVAGRLDYLLDFSQSPAGFFHEATGMDLGYSFRVMLPALADIYHHTEDTRVLASIQRYLDWYGYNMVREPDEAGYVHFTAACARTSGAVTDEALDNLGAAQVLSSLSGVVPAIDAFVDSQEEARARRVAWARRDEPVTPVRKGISGARLVSPIGAGHSGPSDAEKRDAISRLPCFRAQGFAELRTDPARQQYLYLRRSGYYLAACFGIRSDAKVRTGLGLLWHPELGTLIHSSNASDDQCWSTVLDDGPIAASDSLVQFFDGPAPNSTLVGPGGISAVERLGFRYHDGANRVLTDVLVDTTSVTKVVHVSTGFSEQIPLVFRHDDNIRLASGRSVRFGEELADVASGLSVERRGSRFVLDWGVSLPVHLRPTTETWFADGSRAKHVLTVDVEPTAAPFTVRMEC